MSNADSIAVPGDPPTPDDSLPLLTDAARDHEALALTAFDRLVAADPAFRPRPGQRAMAAHIARTLAPINWPQEGETETPPGGPRAVAVVQAGTGVGKSAAYLATVVALGLAHGRRVVVSTATIALQEQLLHKDLPALAASMDAPLTYALAKGRGRYVCRLKLEQLANGEVTMGDLLEENTPPDDALTAAWARQARQHGRWLRQLDAGTWDGDRDGLDEVPDPGLWAPVAAERHTCTGRQCPVFQGCSYFQARARLVQSQVIVVNHDLLLSTLGLHALPDPSACYLVLDEAHHLPQVAQGQFTESMDLIQGQWLDRLPRAVEEVAAAIQHPLGQDVAQLARELKAAQSQFAQRAMVRLSESPAWADRLRRPSATADGSLPVVERLPDGHVPADWMPSLQEMAQRALPLLRVFEGLATQLRAVARERPGEAARCAQLYGRLGALAPRLQHLQATTACWLQTPDGRGPPLAKWLEAQVVQGHVALSAHACPLEPGAWLRQRLWSSVRAAVATSASLASCGGFGHFLHEVGLAGDDAVRTAAVESPFHHARQGRLVVVQTRADPKDADAYAEAMLVALLQDLAQVRRGALVLFTSRALMRRAQARLEDAGPVGLREAVLVQGEEPRTPLLRRHAQRVAEGQVSILFGLQSFGEGLDLPGELCEWVFITKLPFASPSDPVAQARADWLRTQGRDPFSELVVPATGQRLLQWTGRALRRESDEAVVVCYDPRLLRQSYGRRMLQGLPPYRVQQRDAHGRLSDWKAPG